MPVVEALLALINLFLVAMVCGAQLFVLIAVVPYKAGETDDAGVRYHRRALTNLPDRYLLPFGIASAITSALMAVLTFALGQRVATVFYIVGFLGVTVMGTVSESRNKRINARLLALPEGVVPPNYDAEKHSWDIGARWRFGLTATAFAAVMIGSWLTRVSS